mgnify:CR=1 FL=1
MKRLKVLLLKPFSQADELIPPFGLGYLATAIRDKHEVTILDCLKEKLPPNKLGPVLERGQYDIVGIQVFTFHVPATREYSEVIKKILPQARIVLGGPQPSASPRDVFSLLPQADWAFLGEAEIGLPKLLELIALGDLTSASLREVPGLIWREQNNIKVNQQIFFADIDRFGMPAWDLIRPETYPISPHGGFYKNYPIAPIVISRGCPFSCTYCAGRLVSGKRIRYRSAAKVIEEVKLLYHQYGIREIHIEDDNFTFNHELVREFCRLLKESRLDISWTCPNGVRLDTLTEDLLLVMKASGLYFISVGIESGSDRVLREMKKSLTTEKIREKIYLIKKCGLEVSGFFIIGYPTETRQDIEMTIDFACSLGLKRAAFFQFKPFPGSDIARELAERGEWRWDSSSAEDWNKFILADAVYAPPGFTLMEMKKWRQKALRRFYLRPRVIIDFVRDIRGPKHLWLIMKRAYAWLWRVE